MSLTAEEIRNCTMIALDQPPFWPEVESDDEIFKFVVIIPESEYVAYKTLNITLFHYFKGIIDWGDGNRETYNEMTNVQNSLHEYTNPGEYTVTYKGQYIYRLQGGSDLTGRIKAQTGYLNLLEKILTKFPKHTPHTSTQETIQRCDYLLSGQLNLKYVCNDVLDN